MTTLVTLRLQGAYNTEMLAPEEVPRSWEEMADAKWKGMVIYSASAEEMPARFAYMWRKDGQMDWERSFTFFTRLFQQEPLITTGFRRGAEQTTAGERAIFWLTAIGPFAQQHLNGAPVALIAFPQLPTPNFNVSGITNGAPHPAAAWLFIDYLTSPEGQFEYTDTISAKLILNKKARPGKLAQWMIEQGGTLEISAAAASTLTCTRTPHSPLHQ